MGLDVSKVTTQRLGRPQGAALRFVLELAERGRAFGDGLSYGLYTRGDLEDVAKGYAAREHYVGQEGLQEIMEWIGGLPWDEEGYLHLEFDW